MEAFLIGHAHGPVFFPAVPEVRRSDRDQQGPRTGIQCVQASASLHARTAVDVKLADQLADIEREIDAARVDVVHDQTEALRIRVVGDCTRLPAGHLPTQGGDGNAMVNGMGMSRTDVASSS